MKVKEESEKVDLKLNIQKTKIMTTGLITSWKIDGEIVETVADFILGGSKITAECDCSHEIKRCLLLGRKVMTNLDSILKRNFFNKSLSSKGYGFSSSHVWIWELDYKDSWAEELMVLSCGVDSWESLGLQGDPTSPSWRKSVLGVHWKDWCCWNSNTLATWCKELTPLKRPWCWERLRAGTEGMTEDEMVGRHHWLNGHEFGQTLGVGDGQGGLACCNPWGHKESDMTEWLDWTELNWILWKRKIQVCTLSKHRKGMQNFWIAPND